MQSTRELKRGDRVRAVAVPVEATDAPPGTFGVVFEEADAYGDDGGPMVRWATGGACNVYDGWVEDDFNVIVGKLARYSYGDIDYKFEGLTAAEKAIFGDEDTFRRFLGWALA
jgi:hypothetical protein